MSRIRFITFRVERLVAWSALVLLLLATTIFLLQLSLVKRATPVPRAVLWYSIPATTAADESLPTASIGAPAPDFTLASLSGEAVTLTAFGGRPVLLLFWASWCEFCRDDIPALEQAFRENQENGLVVLGINLLERQEAIASFQRQVRVSFPLLLDSSGAVSATYQVRATPTYVFIDRSGVMRSQIVGRPQPAVLLRNLGAILSVDP